MSQSIHLVCPGCHALNRFPAEKLSHHPLCGKCRHALLTPHPQAVNSTGLSQYIEKSDLPVIVDFWAEWCNPCRQFAPVFSEIAAEMAEQACFLKLDTEAEQSTSARYQIRSIPSLLVFFHGKEIARLSGALPKSQFKSWLLQTLDGLKTTTV